MAYEYGESRGAKAENARLTKENLRLTAELTKENMRLTAELDEERRTQKKQATNLAALLGEAEREASTIRETARTQAHAAHKTAQKILTEARTSACKITLAAENHASLIRERAYDQGWALADRDYLETKVRQSDERRARENTLTHLRKAS